MKGSVFEFARAVLGAPRLLREALALGLEVKADELERLQSNWTDDPACAMCTVCRREAERDCGGCGSRIIQGDSIACPVENVHATHMHSVCCAHATAFRRTS